MPRRKQDTETTPGAATAATGGVTCDSDVEELEGVGKETGARLRAAGIMTIRDLAYSSKVVLRQYGIGDETAQKLIRRAIKICGMDVPEPADTFLASPPTISSLVRSIDELLGGGFMAGNMYELVGEYGTGKTQLSFQLSVSSVLAMKNGEFGGPVLFIDTEGTFKAGRVSEMAKARNLDPSYVLSNIYVARVFTPDHLELLMFDTMPNFVAQKNVKLVVIDSLIKLYRSTMPGRENLAERQQRLNTVLATLNTLASRYQIVVVYTNQIVANPVPFTTEPVRPAGGNIVAHAAQYRIELVKKKERIRLARVIDSPDIPPDKYACFAISPIGLEDSACS